MAEEAKEVGGKVEETILRVVTHRVEDLTTPIPIAKVVPCCKCDEKCVVTVATLQEIKMKAKQYVVICSRCSFNDAEFMKEAKYEPFTNEQLAEHANIASVGSIKKGFGG